MVGKYPACSAEELAKEVTIVVTVKDACSQAPGFINSLHTMVPNSVSELSGGAMTWKIQGGVATSERERASIAAPTRKPVKACACSRKTSCECSSLLGCKPVWLGPCCCEQLRAHGHHAYVAHTLQVHLIYTYPNFTSCREVPGLSAALGKWDTATEIALPLRVSPMKGWLDGALKIKTK